MKITAVKTVVVHAGDRNWVLVRVETNEAGLYGWGEGTLEWKTRAVVGCIDDFVPMLIGRDPRDITGLFERMVKHSFWPLGVIGLTAGVRPRRQFDSELQTLADRSASLWGSSA